MAKMEGDLTCAGQCAKKFLLGFNVLFLISGVIAIALGLFIVIFPVSQHIAVLMGNNLYYVAGFILIIAGIAVVVVAICGCCGAKYENKCLLGGYFCALLGIFVIEFLAGILALAFYTQVDIYVDDNLENSLLEQYGLPGEEAVTEAWDFIQYWFECCGVEGNTTEAAVYYTMSLWYVTANVRVPKSCCTLRNYEIVNLHLCQDLQNIDWYTHINNEGCYDIIFSTAVQYSSILAGVGITLSIIQLFGMGFSFCLFRRL